MTTPRSEVRIVLEHLRFPFSLFLLPVFLLALSMHANAWMEALPLFVILHLFIYPSSNGFNSLMDRDEGSIGGIENPVPVPPSMRWVSLMMDGVSVSALALLYGLPVAAMGLVYILVSRAYSHRSIRLKRYAVIGYATVVLFQGAWVFWWVQVALTGSFEISPSTWLGMITSSALIGASYPLTQIYQHDQDKKDGVTTLSYVLGVRGTIAFAAAVFFIFLTGITLYGWYQFSTWWLLPLALVITGPAALFLIQWGRRVWINKEAADFRSSMRMSILGSICMNTLFITVLILAILHHPS